MNQHPNRTRSGAGPTVRQRDVLDAFVRCPSPAAVERTTGMSERHVRRLVDQYGSYVEEQRQARDEERLVRESARIATVQDWLDETLEADLRRLDELTQSSNEGVALRALKTKFDLTARGSIGARRPDLSDGPLANLEAALAAQVEDLKAAT